MRSNDQEKCDPIICTEIEDLTDQEQADRITEHFCTVRQKFSALRSLDILIPPFSDETIPQFLPFEVKQKLLEIDLKKSFPKDDIPPKLLKLFAEHISIPLTDIINASIKQGVWPDMLKNLRSISGLMTCNRVEEKLLSELIILDMRDKMDPTQYGNQHGLSIQHYLIIMVHKILVDVDNKQVTAILATFVDWKDAFPNQCPALGIQAFLDCGVRPSQQY